MLSIVYDPLFIFIIYKACRSYPSRNQNLYKSRVKNTTSSSEWAGHTAHPNLSNRSGSGLILVSFIILSSRLQIGRSTYDFDQVGLILVSFIILSVFGMNLSA
jgi:hypothetical protein